MSQVWVKKKIPIVPCFSMLSVPKNTSNHTSPCPPRLARYHQLITGALFVAALIVLAIFPSFDRRQKAEKDGTSRRRI